MTRKHWKILSEDDDTHTHSFTIIARVHLKQMAAFLRSTECFHGISFVCDENPTSISMKSEIVYF